MENCEYPLECVLARQRPQKPQTVEDTTPVHGRPAGYRTLAKFAALWVGLGVLHYASVYCAACLLLWSGSPRKLCSLSIFE